MKVMTKSKPQDIRFKFHHQLDEIYHQFLDELAESGLTDQEIGKIAQMVMLSRQEAVKRLVSQREMEAYYERYPQEK